MAAPSARRRSSLGRRRGRAASWGFPSGPWEVLQCKRTWCRSRGRAPRPRAPRRGTRAGGATRAAPPAAGSAAGGPSRLPLLYAGQPFVALLVFSGDDVEESLLDLLGDRAGLAGADHAPVELADRRHFGRGAGEERLVGDVDVVASQALGDDLVAHLAG